MTQLRESRVLITGAASGIGRLMAIKAAERGAVIVAWDIDTPALDRLVEEVQARGVRVLGQVVDVADPEAVYAAAAHTEDRFGGVDVLVLNAGVVGGRPLLELSDDAIERVMGVNALGQFWCTKAFLPGMVARDKGHVVTIASVASAVPAASATAYTASKHAAYGFIEALRWELRSTAPRVRTTVVLPYFIETGMFAGVGDTRLPFLHKLSPDYVAERVIVAIERDRQRVVLPGYGVALVYPLRMLPPRAEDWLAERLGFMSPMSTFHGRSVAESPSAPQRPGPAPRR